MLWNYQDEVINFLLFYLYNFINIFWYLSFNEFVYFIYVIDLRHGVVSMRLGEWLCNIPTQHHTTPLKCITLLGTLTWHMESSCLHIKWTWQHYLLSKTKFVPNYLEHSHPVFTCLIFIKLNDAYELEIVKKECIIMFHYLHLPMTYTFMKLDKPHIYVLLII